MTGNGHGERKRICPECDTEMNLAHHGQFSTIFVCPICGSFLTLPPRAPAVRAPDRRGRLSF